MPADRADRVKAAARALWRAEVGRRGRRRWWAAAALAAAAVVAAVGVGVWQRAGVSPGSEGASRVEVVIHSARSRPASDPWNASWSALRPGDPIVSGSELATEDGARLAIRMASGHSVRLDALTRMRVLSERALALDRGAVYVDSEGPDGAAEGSLEIRTPVGRIRDIGTQFEARWMNASLTVRVREGAISLDGAEPAIEVRAGHVLEAGEDGRSVRPDTSARSVGWDWIGDITPMMRIEGRSLKEFLNWIGRERGLRVRFAREDLGRSASRISLVGSIDGMTLDQALDSVLPTCGMRHRIEQGDLLVDSLAESGESP